MDWIGGFGCKGRWFDGGTSGEMSNFEGFLLILEDSKMRMSFENQLGRPSHPSFPVRNHLSVSPVS